MIIRGFFAILFSFFISGCTDNAYFNQYLYPPKQNAPSSYNMMSGKILWHGNKDLPEIALTFDDGPSSKYTPKVLDILKMNNVKGTFFLLGRSIEKNKAIVRRMSDEGHLIGNHTFTHASGKITDIDKIKREIQKTDTLIEKYSGQSSSYFRPPFGFENWRFLAEAEIRDHKVVLWSLDVADWNNHKTDKDIINRMIKHAGNGMIILFHDGGTSREAVISALPTIIKSLKAKGYVFVRIDEMISHL